METKPEVAAGCRHYARHCEVLAECCQNWVDCRLCHNEKFEDHEIDRHAIRKMRCNECHTVQPVRFVLIYLLLERLLTDCLDGAVRSRVRFVRSLYGSVLLQGVQPVRRRRDREAVLPLRWLRDLQVCGSCDWVASTRD